MTGPPDRISFSIPADSNLDVEEIDGEIPDDLNRSEWIRRLIEREISE